MMWFFAILIVLALGGVAAVAAGYGRPMAEAYDDRPDAEIQHEHALTGTDLRAVRFNTALLGYRMSEVDTLLHRLALELDAARDALAAERGEFGEEHGGERGENGEDESA